ncbi:hypothetical protein [Nocardioides campestrisoli]|uniref:hypothetical protein n=1 Tax=Nocardioides campestrisoli TaxID=2736757 RepID=UPI0015E71B08|nr:hypothetical protein [Nocardioides campestrisoli]
MSEKPPEPRLRLRHGVPVLRRAQGRLQVGMDPARRLLLPDTPSVDAFLSGLTAGAEEPEDPELQDVVARLRSRRLLVDRLEVRHRRLARAETRVRLWGSPTGLCRELAQLLLSQGLTLLAPGDGAPADVTVLLSVGEPARDLVDDLTHPGDPVLLVAVIDARVRLGPFVLPGVTACLRCLDAHQALMDPGVPAPPDPRLPRAVEVSELLLRDVALRTAVDVVAWAEGRCPRTWSATTWLDEDLVEEHEAWLRHPHCGCGWDELIGAG